MGFGIPVGDGCACRGLVVSFDRGFRISAKKIRRPDRIRFTALIRV